jgi:hypothetical protein
MLAQLKQHASLLMLMLSYLHVLPVAAPSVRATHDKSANAAAQWTTASYHQSSWRHLLRSRRQLPCLKVVPDPEATWLLLSRFA